MESEDFDKLVKILGLETAQKIRKSMIEREKKKRIRAKRLHTRQRRKIAVHEAGHTVIAHHFGANLGATTIEPNFQTKTTASAEAKYNWDKSFTEIPHGARAKLLQDRIRQRLCRHLAGAAAEYIYMRKPRKFRIHGGGQDFENAENLLRELVQNQSDETYREIISQYFYDAADILESKWEAVGSLSEALIEKGTITGQEATEIIEKNLNSI